MLQELKDKIAEEKGYPRGTQRLYLRNQVLEEDLEMTDLASSPGQTPFEPTRLSKFDHETRLRQSDFDAT